METFEVMAINKKYFQEVILLETHILQLNRAIIGTFSKKVSVIGD